ncbi:NAD-dependent succinate-semialdehyde dehydrogenase (plasmid) [Haloferax mediterranei ATCC 33500]|uniref:Succinate-semialdehyde dehydrogenase n=1 Tax=Haloferax mediterranei (strain ATCC 33500 / DSM 1411 / JCM 8866 / NBRC 14739 / NCIMB 2177 / R-4) TaxID=523841 RepID=I3RAA8_HALMT|nr:NAD-dependent succinate-semialdehyde dehydrogenase [Haloferax mediterranei]AFK21168.1 succinate-semialdehyde dehydrogenase (NADP+) [Haloferax mediterranei ATCC 33500]AHZ24713.1 succinate-semialdehyde dehydrogenase [Haloferax mediterranei ATCC 33500]ELZ97496.1 succinate-semialdehyde dehydrogenase [Haloferax mediterranei ATCC 33500]MDX5990212.1 NAD-dependent succinate-semialdehyde dehydrogenase [Haloferax mediterranei ATCC 33500]QCQ76719.1 NAD-dependent succinate-semialdehyde dehydrogenase [H
MDSVNPATGERIGTYEADSTAVVESKLETAAETFVEWRERPLREREELLAAAGDVLRENEERYATLMTREMGKPISQARAEVQKCAWACDHYAEYASAYLEPEHHPSPPGTKVKTVHEPLGPVLAVMPWNYPFWQVIRFAAPYITAGNVGLLKHASNVPGCAQALEEVFLEAGYPEGAFQSLMVGSEKVDSVIEDDRVRAVTLTGSGPAGRAVAETAGKNLKKTVLELGGSDPFIVLDDADLDAAVETGVLARNQNNGQSCIAAKRFIVHEAVYETYVDRLVSAFADQTIGDPMDTETDIGPQADPDLMAGLHEQVTASVEAGATVRTGGEPLDRTGAYYPPTVLTDIPAGCPADTEELFGPVAAVYKVSDAEEAVDVANDTRFGLGASIWTADRERGERLANRIDAGCVYVNQLTKSDPRVPFGGIGDSGYGRELSGPGIREFVNRKTVWVE